MTENMDKYIPECPFCGRRIARPAVTQTGFGEVLSGKCGCSAVYVCDPTGHNMGEAYSEVLALMKGNWDIGLLDSDSDYDFSDMDYDMRTHTRVYAMGLGKASGKLLFVRSRQEGAFRAAAENKSSGPKVGKAALKKKAAHLLETCSYEELVAIAKQDKSIISRLISLSYDKEDVISWRSMEAIGLIGKELSGENRTEVVRDINRRLLWSMGDESGGIGWSSAEILGEIIMNSPEEFQEIIPVLWSYREEEMFRAGTIWAMGRIATVRPDLVRFALDDLKAMLEDSNPSARGYAAWALGVIGDSNSRKGIGKLLDDSGPVDFYRDGELVKTAVGEIAKEALSKQANG